MKFAQMRKCLVGLNDGWISYEELEIRWTAPLVKIAALDIAKKSFLYIRRRLLLLTCSLIWFLSDNCEMEKIHPLQYWIQIDKNFLLNANVDLIKSLSLIQIELFLCKKTRKVGSS